MIHLPFRFPLSQHARRRSSTFEIVVIADVIGIHELVSQRRCMEALGCSLEAGAKPASSIDTVGRVYIRDTRPAPANERVLLPERKWLHGDCTVGDREVCQGYH